jgi:hypothetical protein
MMVDCFGHFARTRRSLSLVRWLVGKCGPVTGPAQYTRSFGGIDDTSFDSGCKWTGL